MLIRRALFRLFKLVVYLARIWLVLAILYLALPSPLPTEGAVEADLQNGNSILRVFDIDRFFPASDTTRSVIYTRFGGSQYFTMEFQLLRQNEGDILAFGAASDPLESANVFIGIKVVRPRAPYYNFSLEGFSDPYEDIAISDPIILPDIPVGNPGGLKAPVSWIGIADSVLLSWDESYKDIPLRVRRVPSKGLIEIWPESEFWSVAQYGEVPADLAPLVSIRLKNSSTPPSFTFAPYPASSSPSLLFPIRISILSVILIPIAEFGLILFALVIGLFEHASSIMLFILNLAAVGVVGLGVYGVYWWIKNERPSMAVSVADVRQAVDTALDNARTRAGVQNRSPQARDDSEVDLEAQIGVGSPAGFEDEHYPTFYGSDMSNSPFIWTGGLNFTHSVASGDPSDTSVLL
uniref:Uncharacterized protein n=1 Tax=Moniliophthora roreri TaxID=221103 RepID=A0A0W0FWV4_MONRR